ncbi:hypothetical protein [Methylobacterium sp. GC_Met_2]|uniref:hypothetical protein n=1 Tax=Methylobacterium sp. GC_Met_2 TaxID=2937376 RepID=UPI00226BAF7E|nr:hypothetical protein [Methylobacterium sp. GC_Met_2]
MTGPDFIPPIEDLIEGEPAQVAPVDPRSEAHLAMLNRYRLEMAQAFRSISAVAGYLAIVTETADPHGVFDQQVATLDVLVRSAGNSLTCFQNLVASKGIA